MTTTKIGSGKRGESLARSYLEKQGYRILEKNYNTRLGEIDIIAVDNDCICFVEVRSQNARSVDPPEYSINRKKQNQIARVALSYIKRYGLFDRDCRFDVVCIEALHSPVPEIRLIKNAFELDTWYRY